MSTLPKAFSAEDLDELLSEAAKAELERPARSFDPRDAEIVECQPNWYLLEVYEPAQREVERELVKRRFGIFVPEAETTEVRRGRKLTRKSLIFPGYIFVFVWDIARHWARIMRIPGVSQIMSSKPSLQLEIETRGKTVEQIAREAGLTLEQAKLALTEALATSMAHRALVIDEELIDYIRALENGARPVHRKRTRGKRQYDNEVIASRPWSAFPDRLLQLDSEGRNQTLRKALGLS